MSGQRTYSRRKQSYLWIELEKKGDRGYNHGDYPLQAGRFKEAFPKEQLKEFYNTQDELQKALFPII